MNLLDEIIILIEKRNPNIKFQKEADVYILNNVAFTFLDLEQNLITNRGVTHRRFLEYKEKGIMLHQLTSDVAAIKLRNFIISKLKIHPRIHARKCSVKECSVAEYESMLKKYHIQGISRSSVRLGLYHNEVLVAAMGFHRTNTGWLLNRLVFSEYAVVGGASKLLSHFKKVNFGEIETFSNNSYSNGNVYAALGFKRENENISDMWYVDKFGKLLNRRKYQKQNLSKLLDKFDPSLTENENMINNGFGVYYGPGTVKWVLR